MRRSAQEDPDIQKLLAAAIMDTPEILVVLLDRLGRIVQFSRGCERVTGCAAADVLGRPLWDLGIVAPEDLERAIAGTERLLAGEPSVPWESRWLDRAGARHPIAWTNFAMGGDGEDARHIVRIGIDLTELRAAEARERERLDELGHLDRVQTAGELASMLAHELNQPLAAIAQYAAAAQQRLDAGGADRDKLAPLLERIAEQALRAGRTIAELRGFLTKTPPEVGRVDPNVPARAAHSLITAYARARGVDVALDLAAGLPPIGASAVLVEQILVNLIRNAVESIAFAGMAAGRVTLTTRAADRAVRFTVSDTGPGLTSEAAERIFAPFYTTKQTGLGMGLRIGRSLAEAQGGRLWAEPHAPGAVFHFELPVAE